MDFTISVLLIARSSCARHIHRWRFSARDVGLDDRFDIRIQFESLLELFGEFGDQIVLVDRPAALIVRRREEPYAAEIERL